MNVPAPINATRPGKIPNVDDLPALGSWWWVTQRTWEKVTGWRNGRPTHGEEETTREVLMCVSNVASNHVEFETHDEEGHSSERVGHGDLLAMTRPEADWKAVLQQRIADKRCQVKLTANARVLVLSTEADGVQADATVGGSTAQGEECQISLSWRYLKSVALSCSGCDTVSLALSTNPYLQVVFRAGESTFVVMPMRE